MLAYRPRTRRTQLLVQELPDEVLIYDMERNEVHCLNGSAARVWALCDGEKTIAEIARLIAAGLDPESGDALEVDAAEALVWCAVDQFVERHLLENPIERDDADEPDDRVGRSSALTRREMMMGLGLIVGMIPVVDSIVSPPAAMAASGTSCSMGSPTNGLGSTPCPT